MTFIISNFSAYAMTFHNLSSIFIISHYVFLNFRFFYPRFRHTVISQRPLRISHILLK